MNTIFYNDYNSVSQNKPSSEQKDPSRNIDKAIEDRSLFDRILRVLFECFGFKRQEGAKSIPVEQKKVIMPINSIQPQIMDAVDDMLARTIAENIRKAEEYKKSIFNPQPVNSLGTGNNSTPTTPSIQKNSAEPSFNFIDKETQAPQQNFCTEFASLEKKFNELVETLIAYKNYGSNEDRINALFLFKEIENGITEIKPRDSMDSDKLELLVRQFEIVKKFNAKNL